MTPARDMRQQQVRPPAGGEPDPGSAPLAATVNRGEHGKGQERQRDREPGVARVAKGCERREADPEEDDEQQEIGDRESWWSHRAIDSVTGSKVHSGTAPRRWAQWGEEKGTRHDRTEVGKDQRQQGVTDQEKGNGIGPGQLSQVARERVPEADGMPLSSTMSSRPLPETKWASSVSVAFARLYRNSSQVRRQLTPGIRHQGQDQVAPADDREPDPERSLGPFSVAAAEDCEQEDSDRQGEQSDCPQLRRGLERTAKETPQKTTTRSKWAIVNRNRRMGRLRERSQGSGSLAILNHSENLGKWLPALSPLPAGWLDRRAQARYIDGAVRSNSRKGEDR